MKKLILFLLVLVGLLQYRLWFGDGGIREYQRTLHRIDELRAEGERLRERNAALDADVRDLKEGTDAIEERARQELGMIRAGETFVQVVEHVPPPPAAIPEQPRRPAAKSGKRSTPKAKPGPRVGNKKP